ncbi:amphi-Trp domain-containing protein [Marinomonas balearica]|uniref:Amphi-Trp domain-containing protein n=1 Tax=Marinomonas balearica TaxID=491947 RepID=A0A4R6MBR6_9GAMM|nr:amphi-Trp domain-containing protein [Marinomonas balearica]TDO98953.1 amphi-Trp domain-containing protein [Marinomonas balearica]
MKSKTEFKHEALLDASDIQDVLKAISKGMGKGKLEFSDDKDGELLLHPQGLLRLKVTASEEDDRQQFEIKVRWEKSPKAISKNPPKIA